MIFLVSGSPNSEGDPLLTFREGEYDAVTKVINEILPLLCDNEQCRHGVELPAESEIGSESSGPIDIELHFLELVNQDSLEVVNGIISDGGTKSERKSMTVLHVKNLFNDILAATVILPNPIDALANVMSIFKRPSDNARKAKEVIDRYANVGPHQGLFSDLDLPQHVAHLGQKLIESGADTEALKDLFSVFDHPSNVLLLAKKFLKSSADGEALEGLSSMMVYPSDNAAHVKRVLHIFSNKETRLELISLLWLYVSPLVPNLLKSGADVEALKALFSLFNIPGDFDQHLSKLVESGADAEALAELLSLFEHSSLNVRLVNLVLSRRHGVEAPQNLLRFFNDFPNAAQVIIRLINAGGRLGSPEVLFQVFNFSPSVACDVMEMVKYDSDSTNLEELFFQILNPPASVLPLLKSLFEFGDNWSYRPIRNLPPAEFRKSAELVLAFENLFPIFKLSYHKNLIQKHYEFGSVMFRYSEHDPVGKTLKDFFQIFKVPYDEGLLIKAIKNTGIDGHCYGISFDALDHAHNPHRLGWHVYRKIKTALGGLIADFLGDPDMVRKVANEIIQAENNAILNHNSRPDSFLSQLISLIGPKPVVCVGAQAMNLKRIIGDAKHLMKSDWDNLLSPFFDCLDHSLGKTDKNDIGLNQYLVELVWKEIKELRDLILPLRRDFLVQRLISIIVRKPTDGIARKAKDNNIAFAEDLANNFSCLQWTLNSQKRKSFTKSDLNDLLTVFFDYLDLRSDALGNDRQQFIESLLKSVDAKESSDYLLATDVESGMLFNAVTIIRYLKKNTRIDDHIDWSGYNSFRGRHLKRAVKRSFGKRFDYLTRNRLGDLKKFVGKLADLLKHGKIDYSLMSDEQKGKILKFLSIDE